MVGVIVAVLVVVKVGVGVGVGVFVDVFPTVGVLVGVEVGGGVEELQKYSVPGPPKVRFGPFPAPTSKLPLKV